MATTVASCQTLLLRNFLREVTGSELKSVTLYIDKKSSIALMKNLIFHERNKHIDTRFHVIRECFEKRQIILDFVSNREQSADILNKPLTRVKFAEMREMLGVKNLKQNQVYGGDCELINLC